MLLKQFYKTPLLEMPESSDLITEDANNIYIYPITCDLLRNEASRIIWLLRLQEINIYILYQHKYLSTFIDKKKKLQVHENVNLILFIKTFVLKKTIVRSYYLL